MEEEEEDREDVRGAACHSSSEGQRARLKSAGHGSPDPCSMSECVCGSSQGITAGAEDVSYQPQASEQVWGIGL